jgi:hypothetical protein
MYSFLKTGVQLSCIPPDSDYTSLSPLGPRRHFFEFHIFVQPCFLDWPFVVKDDIDFLQVI